METDLHLAQRAAIVGASVALRHFAALADLPRELKADGSVVTAADRAVEAAIREVITAARPGDAILGEEAGQSGDSGRRWIIDPIDGTALFVAGDDRWLTLIALEEDGVIVTGVAAHPAQSVVCWAQRGGGAFEGRIVGSRVVADTPIQVAAAPHTGITTPSDELAAPDASVTTSSDDATVPGGSVTTAAEGATAPADELAAARVSVLPENWAPELVAPLKAVTPALPWRIHPGLLVARGDLDLAVQTGGQVWDFAATSLIVTEAGGVYSGLDGRLTPGPGPSIYARDPNIQAAALKLLS